MSDPTSSYGEPVDEPRDDNPESVDDVVGRAEEGLADAEAAGREAVGADQTDGSPDADAPDSDADAAAAEAPDAVSAADAPAAEAPAAESADRAESAPSPAAASAPSPVSPTDEPRTVGGADTGWEAEAPSWADDAAATTAYDAPASTDADATAATTAYTAPIADEPAVTASEPGYDAGVVAGAAAVGSAAGGQLGQPIFVQAPESPRPRGNRAAAGAIGLLAALSFGVLYLVAWLGFGLIRGDITTADLGDAALAALGTWSLWVPVVVFFIAFWLLGAIINRGRWGAWVIFGLLVGIAAYGGHLLGQLFQAPFWMLTASEGAALVEAQLLAPLAIAAFVIGRELTIWFGAWAAARGKRVTELNIEAQREYERTLEAGPQLVRM